MESSVKILEKYGLRAYAANMNLELAKEIGEEVIYDGELAAYYVVDGFEVYSAFVGNVKGSNPIAFRVAMVMTFLNRDKDRDQIFEYMDALCIDRFDTDNFKISRTMISKVITSVLNGEREVDYDIKKYYWVGKYQYADKFLKSSIVMSSSNKSRAEITFSKISKAVDSLIENDNNNTFITIQDIFEISGVSIPTIKRYIGLFRESIDRYNQSNFLTNNYGEFLKFCSIGKISNSIRLLIEEMDSKLTQRKVAIKSQLHFNTVNNLWYEEDVQDALNEYNRWKVKSKEAI